MSCSLLFGVKLRDVFRMMFSAPLTCRGWSQIIFAARPMHPGTLCRNQSILTSSHLCFTYIQILMFIIYFVQIACQLFFLKTLKIISIGTIPAIDPDKAKVYKDFISYSFSQHGKSLKERVRHIFTKGQINFLSNNTGFSITDSPVDLKFEQWLQLFHYFNVGVSVEKRSLVSGSCSRLINQQRKLEKIHRNRRNL